MSIFTVSIAFDSSEGSWQVSRAHTVVATYASRSGALHGANEVAGSLRRRMHCDTRLRVKDRHGGWHVCTSIGGDRSAITRASRMLSQLRSTMPGSLFSRRPGAPSVFFAAKNFT